MSFPYALEATAVLLTICLHFGRHAVGCAVAFKYLKIIQVINAACCMVHTILHMRHTIVCCMEYTIQHILHAIYTIMKLPKSTVSFCHQVAAWVPNMFHDFHLLRNHKIAKNPTTAKAREKMSTDLES